MSSAYLGTLEAADPLYSYLVKDVMPKVSLQVRNPTFHVSRLSGSNLVYRYQENASKLSLIGKFYTSSETAKGPRLIGEYHNLRKARALGLTGPPNRVVRPLASKKSLGLGLMEEYVEGRDLDHYIRRAAFEGRHDRLKARLSDLAFFLSEFHKRTTSDFPLSLARSSDYFDRILSKLGKKGLIDYHLERVFIKLKDAWLERDYMKYDRRVLVHGDATPTNFIFPEGQGCIAIDLERMRPDDRMMDVGMICGELKHSFLWRTGNKYISEDHIGHFLNEYAGYFGHPDNVFKSIVRRNPFYMALTELRIARNSWLDREHRKSLVAEARECLAWGLKLS
ncbi:MAG: aminoglycoside phosphotransferase family protein [Nitrospirota bacterium]